MGRASHALKKVLETFSISQNRLAVTLGIDRSAVFKWFHEQREPTSETIVEITIALKQLNPEAARQFVQFYLGELLEDQVEGVEESPDDINLEFPPREVEESPDGAAARLQTQGADEPPNSNTEGDSQAERVEESPDGNVTEFNTDAVDTSSEQMHE